MKLISSDMDRVENQTRGVRIMTNAGIDYGMGRTNVDHATGIRYGVISQNEILQAWADSSEADYGKPTCPKCGNEAITYDADKDGSEESPFDCGHGCADFMCESCEYVFDSQDAYGEEPQGYSYSGDGYEMVDCLDSDVMVIASPFYTFARFCSPCVPGAGNLNDAGDESYGVKTFCVGHDWFDDGKAPYPVYRVDTGELVSP